MPVSSNPSSRRAFLKRSAAAASVVAASSAIPRPLLASFGPKAEPIPPIQDARIKELVQRGLDTARSSGATYADVRLAHTRRRDLDHQNINDHEAMTVDVRALVQGYWGFASGPVWTPDEMVRLAREATSQARMNALGKPRIIEFVPVPTVDNGHWEMPVKIDPFMIYPVEIQDYLQGLRLSADLMPYTVWGQARVGCFLFVQEKAFGATNGSYFTQRTYRTSGKYATDWRKGEHGGTKGVEVLYPSGVGFELFQGQPLDTLLRQAILDAIENAAIPVKAVDTGRYDVLFDATSMTEVVGKTIGNASELDRAMGYEANAGGTSYLNEPLEMFGQLKLSTPLVNVTANRSEAGGLATVQWDDEGVRPETFPIVKDGILTDFQTTREGAGWLKDVYQKAGRSVQSRGCAYAPSALEVPLAHTANLRMEPGTENLGWNDLIKTMKRGIAFRTAMFSLDFQQLNGLGHGAAYEIKDGKVVARVASAGVLFRAPELWKNIIAIGGVESVRSQGLSSEKGEPPQTSHYTVTAVPTIVKEMAVIDILRKA